MKDRLERAGQHNMTIFLIILAMLLTTTFAIAGSLGDVRKGNTFYKKGDYAAAEKAFRQAQRRSPEWDIPGFNLADAIYRQSRYREAGEEFSKLTSSKSPPLRGRAFYNLGNSLFEQKEYEKAAEAFIQSLRINPEDRDAKINLELALKKLEQTKKGKQQKMQKKEENAGKQEKASGGKQQGKPSAGKEKKEQKKPAPSESPSSREDALRILNAFLQNENDARDKVRRVYPQKRDVNEDW